MYLPWVEDDGNVEAAAAGSVRWHLMSTTLMITILEITTLEITTLVIW